MLLPRGNLCVRNRVSGPHPSRLAVACMLMETPRGHSLDAKDGDLMPAVELVFRHAPDHGQTGTGGGQPSPSMPRGSKPG